MPNRACVVVPYFGRLPSHFPLWLSSCRTNSTFDWVVLTDDGRHFDVPDNVELKLTRFEDFIGMVQGSLSLTFGPIPPYKICDFRPAFGVIFEDLFTDYDFWGYCDLDMIFGDISQFLTDAVLAQHMKVFKRGHFSLHRNTPEVNFLFREIVAGGADFPITFDDVLAERNTLAFDESVGIYRYFTAHDYPVYVEEVTADISPVAWMMRFTKYSGRNHPHQIFYWKDGRVVHRFLDDTGVVREEEKCYIHFGKREMRQRVPDEAAEFLVASDGFRVLGTLPSTPAEFRKMNGGSLPGDLSLRARLVRKRVAKQVRLRYL